MNDCDVIAGGYNYAIKDGVLKNIQSAIKNRVNDYTLSSKNDSHIDDYSYLLKDGSADFYEKNDVVAISEGFGKMISLNKNPTQSLYKSGAIILQKWEGYVISVEKNTFWARIIPTKGEGVEQEVEIYKKEVLSDEQLSIEKGSVFYWSIGYDNTSTGRRKKSIIRFRRKLNWDNADYKRIANKVKKLEALFSFSSKYD